MLLFNMFYFFCLFVNRHFIYQGCGYLKKYTVLYCETFGMNTKILVDFYICISVPLKLKIRASEQLQQHKTFCWLFFFELGAGLDHNVLLELGLSYININWMKTKFWQALCLYVSIFCPFRADLQPDPVTRSVLTLKEGTSMFLEDS